MVSSGKVPCTILTGFLGSGKTTLLNHIIQSHHGKCIAVIENEFGVIGIKDMIAQGSDGFNVYVEEEILELTSGCVCGTVRGDLIRCLKSLRKRASVANKPLDHILIETSGFADPAVVVQTFFADAVVNNMCSLDGILTLVDAERFMQQLNEGGDYVVETQFAKQLAYADMIFVSKADLVDDVVLGLINARIRAINPSAPIRLALHSQIDMKSILGIDAWSLKKVLDTEEGFADDAIHSVITCNFLESLNSVECFNMAGKKVFASNVPQAEEPFGPWLWRAAKGRATKGRLHLVQSNGDDIWVEPKQPCASSVGISVQGEVDCEKFHQWMDAIRKENSENLFRYKGIVALEGENAPFVFQGIQTWLTGAENIHRDGLPDDERRCKIHFTGNSLNRDELIGGFMACMI